MEFAETIIKTVPMLNHHDSSNILFRVRYTMLNTRCGHLMCFIFFFFSSQLLQCVNFKITSKTFSVSSEHASTVPVLDDRPRLFKDPSKLALRSVFWLIAFSKLESCPIFCKYNFAFSASSFNFSSSSFSHCDEIDSVWLFQLSGLVNYQYLK